MSEGKLLIVDDDTAYADTLKLFLERKDYGVEVATNVSSGLSALVEGAFDVALLDVRLNNDNDLEDISGINLAKQYMGKTPIVMLSQYDTIDYVREALQQSDTGNRIAVAYVLKEDGHEAILTSVRRTMQVNSNFQIELDNWEQAVLRANHKAVSQESSRSFNASLMVSWAGIGIIFLTIILKLFSTINWELTVISTIGGMFTQLIGYFFYARQDQANSRMDKYHTELLAGPRLKLLMAACNEIDVKTKRNESMQHVLEETARNWFSSPQLSAQAIPKIQG